MALALETWSLKAFWLRESDHVREQREEHGQAIHGTVGPEVAGAVALAVVPASPLSMVILASVGGGAIQAEGASFHIQAEVELRRRRRRQLEK